MDNRVALAREANRLALASESQARGHRVRRDAFVRRLHEDGWSYSKIAREVGISKALTAVIIRVDDER